MSTGLNYKSGKTEEANQLIKDAVDEVYEPSLTRKLGIALVGLGNYSEGQLAPALQATKYCSLAGIVTGTPSKIPEWQAKYNIPAENIYDYRNFDAIAGNTSIDIVYIVLPNSLHKEFVIRGAKAGKHVICEKPLGISVQECDEMINACRQMKKLLSVGYRLHFEPHHRELMTMGQERVFGNIVQMKAKHGIAHVHGWRLDKTLAGGGPLMDLGIYCIQAARYTTGLEPVAVSAKEGTKTNSTLFASIEESVTWELEFPGGEVAYCETSYSNDMNLFHVEAAHGWFELSPAYEYDGINGKTATGFMNLPDVNQQAMQMDDFARAIVTSRPVKLPGEMGKMDLRIIEAVYKAMHTGQKVTII